MISRPLHPPCDQCVRKNEGFETVHGLLNQCSYYFAALLDP